MFSIIIKTSLWSRLRKYDGEIIIPAYTRTMNEMLRQASWIPPSLVVFITFYG